MRQLMQKFAAVGFLVFVGLWVGGTVRGYALPYPQAPIFDFSSISFDRLQNARVQAANNLKQMGLATTPVPLVLEGPDVEQIEVYERIAYLGTASRAFEDDEAQLRSAVAGHQGTIFNESSSGLAPDRQLTLDIGVHPEKFDALLQELKQLGKFEHIHVQQRDRTADFRQLNAKRQALKKYLEATLKLRGVKDASIDDTLKVEQRIQEIEKELQAVGVQLGDLLGKESFYHIQMSLREYQTGSRHDREYTMPKRVAHAFVWAMAWWCAAAIAAGVAVGAAVSVRILWPRGVIR
ncbi:MAG: DUF4349 domain-containing protein [Gemmataceae bacterium]|nr:DUF4349 domain-containing protein [Gemmataceae bacterium]